MGPHRSVDLYITPEAHSKQQALVDECEGEVGWFGLVDKININDNGHVREVDRVYDLLVPEQEVSYGHVDHDGFDLNEFLEEHQDRAHEMLFYGHSHVHGICRPSHIDLGQIDRWEEYGMPYFYSHIQNKYGEMYTRMDQWGPRHIIAPVSLKLEINPTAKDWAGYTRETVVHHLTPEQMKNKYKIQQQHW